MQPRVERMSEMPNMDKRFLSFTGQAGRSATPPLSAGEDLLAGLLSPEAWLPRWPDQRRQCPAHPGTASGSHDPVRREWRLTGSLGDAWHLIDVSPHATSPV